MKVKFLRIVTEHLLLVKRMGKMWKIRNIHEGKLAVFGESKPRKGVIKRVYKLNTIPVVNNGEKKMFVVNGNGECRINRA